MTPSYRARSGTGWCSPLPGLRGWYCCLTALGLSSSHLLSFSLCFLFLGFVVFLPPLLNVCFFAHYWLWFSPMMTFRCLTSLTVLSNIGTSWFPGSSESSRLSGIVSFKLLVHEKHFLICLCLASKEALLPWQAKLKPTKKGKPS